jgi:hypothetical protein
MKHILPILTLTTLAAAASAQAAAPAGLSYNRVGFTRQSQNNSLSASALLGSSNVLASVTQGSAYYYGSATTFSLGYVFKNVAYATDATVSVSAGNEVINSAVSVNLRRALNEVYAGLEVAVGYSYVNNENQGYMGDPKGTTGIVSAELAYNVNKTWQVAIGLNNQNPTYDRTTSLTVRHNF